MADFIKVNRRQSGKIMAGFLALVWGVLIASTGPASAQSVAFKQAVAEAAANDKAIATFYRDRDYQPIWTGNSDEQRRRAFLDAASHLGDHGLPSGRYDAEQLRADFGSVRSAKGRGILEVETTRRFLQYADDIQSGILNPSRISKDMYVIPPRRDRLAQLVAFSKSSPAAYFRALPPQQPEYGRLLKEKARLERILGQGDWGPKVNAKKLQLKRQAEESIRNQLAEFAKEIEQLKKLHKQH